MGLFDDAKARAKDLQEQAEDVADRHGDKIKQGLDQAEGLIADKLPQDRSDQAGAIVDKAKEMVDRLADGEPDAPQRAATREQR